MSTSREDEDRDIVAVQDIVESVSDVVDGDDLDGLVNFAAGVFEATAEIGGAGAELLGSLLLC